MRKTSTKNNTVTSNESYFDDCLDENSYINNRQFQKQLENYVHNSFFYTQDNIIDELDHDNIINEIIKRYPGFSLENNILIIKSTLLEILNNEKFVMTLLKHFKISIFDFFTVIYKNYSPIFNSHFLIRIKNEIKNKQYLQVTTDKYFK